MEFNVYLWVEDVMVFIRELIRFFRMMHPDNKIEYREKYDKLDAALDRYIYLGDTGISIIAFDYMDLFDLLEYNGANVNLDLYFNVVGSSCEEMSRDIAEIANWIMETSDTDLLVIHMGGILNFKRVHGEIYYGRESDFSPWEYIPVEHLNFDREKAYEFSRYDG